MSKTTANVLRSVAVPQAPRLGALVLNALLDDTLSQPNQVSASRLGITQTCNASGQQSCKPCEDEGLLTLIFINQLAGLQVSTACS